MLFNSTSTGDKSGEGTANLSRESEFTYGFGGIVWVSHFLPLIGSGYPPPFFGIVKPLLRSFRRSAMCVRSIKRHQTVKSQKLVR